MQQAIGEIRCRLSVVVALAGRRELRGIAADARSVCALAARPGFRPGRRRIPSALREIARTPFDLKSIISLGPLFGKEAR